MSDQTRTGTYGSSYGSSYDTNANLNNTASRQTIKFLTAAAIGVSLMLLSGLILTGTVIGLIIATPLLVLFSPIIVPAAIVLLLVASGFLFSGGCGVAAVAALSWIYNYVAGKHPVGSDTLDYAKGVIADKARDVKEKAKDYAQGATTGSTTY
ncbi:hypothetical protein Lal_00005044 [Lupinus albus]|uniref:Oleosin n=1 Tax=Lupinus albus TaxID=3870 RepID=A0A6A4NIE2_LUPAL|nr:putative oleosin [Lupinus albus]KAF1865666.1 hypothetical protein Lal_00005044 [Lupinus albus]